MKKLLLILLLICTSTYLTANQQSTNEEADTNEIESLDWKFTGTYKLPVSHSSLSVPAEHLALIGSDAKKLSELDGNGIDDDLEAITIDESFKNSVYFLSHKDGYVSLDDWEKIDPKKLLEAISERTEETNEDRRKKGIPEIHVIGWLQEPTLDRHTSTIYWAIDNYENDKEENTFNSVALRLGRNGYERIIWVGDTPDYVAFGGELDVMLRAHSFDPGHRYCDYTTGDKVATYGVTTLVAATAGAKIAKAGGFAALLVLLKKFGGFIAAGFAAIFCKKGMSSKTKEWGKSDE